MPVWRGLLEWSATLYDTGDIQAIYIPGMDRIAASQHYAKCTIYAIKTVKNHSIA